MSITVGSLLQALSTRYSGDGAATAPASSAPGGAGASGPVWPLGSQWGDGFEPLPDRVNDRQTSRTINQGTEEGVDAPVVLGGTLPTIDQQDPAGNGLYVRGNVNCGPTCMAMIARGDPDATLNGVPVSQMSDTQLVMALSLEGGTDRGGTSPNGEIAMAESLGYHTASATGGLHPAFVDATLAAGGSVIVNGGMPLEGDLSGHYMVVTGMDTHGDYIANDPWTGETVTMTPEALDAYLQANPVNGGWSIAVW
ncbi:MAG TPA: papain-like cysteine protease family protein [Myxococcales bacterium]|jgi:hypothetical protein|nr:papain-like cysteine protease family protein [Myxococcales bacterium]